MAADGATGAGDAFPADYSLQDSSGHDVDLRTLLRRGPLIVVFFRGCTPLGTADMRRWRA